ncbi:metal ABC transporter ATP-binding protein [Homoserinimonas sp. OAct 916]|uniref:metal ABC transporter ATP-binding protein n=1 Tax=Homoserinimonas sp. OAct 916 TaxID=2211450 RepID=UPI000DBE37FB|nr:metal ABC transporter ATP-binding protein [Homoserinimonas sp. OAct 916]
MRQPAIEVRNLSISYFGTSAVTDVSFRAAPGTMTAIVGPNGAGKSTLLKGILKLIEPDAGEVTIFGRPVGAVRKQIAYVPQRGDVDWNFPINALDTALLGTYPRLGVFRRPGKHERAIARDCLNKVGMSDHALQQIGTLSGGQQQRVFLARALAQQADIILLDEPFVGVDATSERLIVQILHELRDAGATILVVHHDLVTATDYYDHALLLNRRLLAHGPVGEVLTPDRLAEAYQSITAHAL